MSSNIGVKGKYAWLAVAKLKPKRDFTVITAQFIKQHLYTAPIYKRVVLKISH